MTEEETGSEPQNEETHLTRAESRIDPDDFTALYDLNRECVWLESEHRPLIELWNMCDSKDQKLLISDLIRRTELVDSQKLIDYGKQIAKTIEIDWSLSPKTTRIVAVSDDAEADGSQAFLNSIKNKFDARNDWSEKYFFNNIGLARDDITNGRTYILLDDFIGTGETIERRVKWFIDQIKKKGNNSVSIKVVAIAAMVQSKVILDKLDIDYYCPVWLKRGISDSYNGRHLNDNIKNMGRLEDKLSKRHSGLFLSQFKFGFDRSEALFCIHGYNVPNNVFPIFWWPKTGGGKWRKTIFSRLR